MVSRGAAESDFACVWTRRSSAQPSPDIFAAIGETQTASGRFDQAPAHIDGRDGMVAA